MIRYFWPSDDEQLAGQWVDSHMSEDAQWWVGIQQCAATIALAVTLAITASATATAIQVFSQSQDDPAGNLAIQPLVQEEYWQNSVPPVNWPQPQVKLDDDVHPTFVSAFTPDDGDWRPLAIPVPGTNYVPLPVGFDDQIPHFTAVNPVTDDNESIWSPQIAPWDPNWNLLFWLDDGSTVPVFQADEDFWNSGVAPQLWWTAQQPFQASDDDAYAQTFLGNDEHYWWPQIPAVADSLLLQQQWPFEQNEQVANLVAFTNEDYAPPLVPPVPDSIWLLRQDGFDSQDPVGFLTLILDDGFWPNFVPPVADSLRLLQQWPFDDFESTGALRTTVDEDFWLNPTQPFNWPQPKLAISDDDVIETFVAAFQPDEDFRQWPIVPPVIASNIYWQPFNLLGQQEDDTPVLVPFVPPPPIFCPLPPTGPDGDIKMSNFGGTKPTLALFCRICKSGNPLVVRADYAIWCQDCCAFVSKQDTYMGTVQAPGQFRSTF